MKWTPILVLAMAACGAPDSGPVPIAFGEDTCDVCRMIISEAPYAAEARFGPDKVEKYDDIGCLAERLFDEKKPASMWVADQATGRLQPLESVHLVHVPDLKTPMGSGVAAFAVQADAEAFAARNRGRFVSLKEIQKMRLPHGEP